VTLGGILDGLLPVRTVRDVLRWPVWTCLGDRQVKLTRSFTPDRWQAEAAGSDHGEPVRQAIADAVALVACGRSAPGRAWLPWAMAGDPGLAWPGRGCLPWSPA
jgi:hypothetical protein